MTWRARSPIGVMLPMPAVGRTVSAGNSEGPEGPSTRQACSAAGMAAFAWYMRIDLAMLVLSQ